MSLVLACSSLSMPSTVSLYFALSGFSSLLFTSATTLFFKSCSSSFVLSFERSLCFSFDLCFLCLCLLSDSLLLSRSLLLCRFFDDFDLWWWPSLGCFTSLCFSSSLFLSWLLCRCRLLCFSSLESLCVVFAPSRLIGKTKNKIQVTSLLQSTEVNCQRVSYKGNALLNYTP